jgi:hypothetical protein
MKGFIVSLLSQCFKYTIVSFSTITFLDVFGWIICSGTYPCTPSSKVKIKFSSSNSCSLSQQSPFEHSPKSQWIWWKSFLLTIWFVQVHWINLKVKMRFSSLNSCSLSQQSPFGHSPRTNGFDESFLLTIWCVQVH